MNRRVHYPLLFFILCFSLFAAQRSFACGTVNGWVDIYYNDSHARQDEALYKINCKTLITKNYKATPSEQESLAKMIRKGLKSIEYCDRSLATKNFFLFDQLFWLQGSEVYNEITADIEDRINRPVESVSGELSLYEGEGREDYCARVNYEIKGMQWNGESKCITNECKGIEISSFKVKLGRIASFTHQADECFDEESKIAPSDKIVQVKSETLTMRKTPHPKGAGILKLKRADLLLLKSEKNGWLRVMNKNCIVGWVGGYLTKDARGR